MKPVFADAFYYVALLNKADIYHQKAVNLSQLSRERLMAKAWAPWSERLPKMILRKMTEKGAVRNGA
ncbi:MAG: hypothetical protein PHV34_19945 [Verrucomicrobiae bacterium]|nr:hypothetical protein [Verrucomicrobiae bacterium]